MVLTGKQRGDLHEAMLEYLVHNGFSETAAALAAEAQLQPRSADAAYSKALENKWTSVLRLQRKVIDLEAEVKLLRENPTAARAGNGKDKKNALPRPPPRLKLQGHRAPITRVAYHPTFAIVATASEDATVKIWDTEGDGARPEATLKGHTEQVTDVTFSPSGELIASSSSDLRIKIWDSTTYECIRTLSGHDHNISGVVFLPSGDHLVSCSRDKTIRMWEVETGYCVKTLTGHDEWVRKVIASPDGSMIASCSYDHSIRVWSSSTGACLATLMDHTHAVMGIAFAHGDLILPEALRPRGSAAAAVAGADTITSSNGNGAAGVAGASNARGYLVSGSRDKTVRVWDLASASCIMVLSGHDSWINSVLVHPNGKYVLSASDDKTIRVWDLEAQRCCRTLHDAHTHFVTSIDWHSKYPELVSGSVDQSVLLWNCQ